MDISNCCGEEVKNANDGVGRCEDCKEMCGVEEMVSESVQKYDALPYDATDEEDEDEMCEGRDSVGWGSRF